MSGRGGAGTPGRTGRTLSCPDPGAGLEGKAQRQDLCLEGGRPFSRGGAAASAEAPGNAPRPGERGAAAGLSSLRTPRPLLSLSQRARGPRRSWCLTQRSAGRGRAPPHCSTETRASSPCPGPGAGPRGPFLVSGWTRSYSVPRRPPKPHPQPIHLSDPVGSGLGSPFLCSPLLCLSCSLSSLSYVSALLYLSLFSLSYRLFSCPPIFCPVSVSPGLPPPLHILPGRSHWKDQTLPIPSFFLK